MNVFINFLFTFINGLSTAWDWLTTPFDGLTSLVGFDVTPLGLFGITSIIGIVGFKVLRLIIG